jgi:hypothetical protein
MFILLILLNQIYLLSFNYASSPVAISYYSAFHRDLNSVQLALIFIDEITKGPTKASETFPQVNAEIDKLTSM